MPFVRLERNYLSRRERVFSASGRALAVTGRRGTVALQGSPEMPRAAAHTAQRIQTPATSSSSSSSGSGWEGEWEKERERQRENERERERGNETQQRGAAHSEAARHITSLLSTPEEAELWRGERRHSPLHLLSDNVRTCRGKIHCNHLKLLLWNGLSSDWDGFYVYAQWFYICTHTLFGINNGWQDENKIMQLY